MLLADTTGQRKWEFSSAGRASALQAGCHRFEPCNSHHFLNNVLKYDAGVAQLVEQSPCKRQVISSSLIGSFPNPVNMYDDCHVQRQASLEIF